MSGVHASHRPTGSSPRAVRSVVALVLLSAVAVAVGAVVLWPPHLHVRVPAALQAQGGPVQTVAGEVTGVVTAPCGGQGDTVGQPVPPATAAAVPTVGAYTCDRVAVLLRSGPERGQATVLEISPGPGQPVLAVGEGLRMARAASSVPGPGSVTYYYADVARGVPLAVLALVFAVVVVLVGRWRGVAALAGLGVTFGVLLVFVIPALLAGESPLGVAVVGTAGLALVVLYLAHGVSLRTSAALLGTLAALALTAVLGRIAVPGTHLTGLADEQNTSVQAYASKVQISGLLLAGLVIGAVGVLNDVTVTQASAVFELAEDPCRSRARVFAAAMRVGRDHIASTVYTLVLAYAGAALPVLLLLSISGRAVTDVLTGDLVGEEIVRTAVGGIGLALAVPLTTGLAVLLARPGGSVRVASGSLEP